MAYTVRSVTKHSSNTTDNRV